MILALALAIGWGQGSKPPPDTGPPESFKVWKGPVTSLLFTEEGTLFAAGDFVVVRVDANGKTDRALDLVWAVALAANREGDLLVVGGEPAAGSAGRWVSRKLASVTDAHVVHSSLVMSAALSGEIIATGSHDGLIKVRNGGKWLDLAGHSGPVLALDFARDHLISAGSDRTLRVWETATGKLARTLTNHTGSVNALASLGAPNGQPTWATASDDRTVRIWQPLIGRMVRILRGAEGPLLAVANAGDDRVVSGGQEGVVRLQDSTTGEVLAKWTYPGQWVHSLAVHGGRMAVGLSNSAVHLVDLPKAPHP